MVDEQARVRVRRGHRLLQAGLAFAALASIGILALVTRDWVLYGVYALGVLAFVAPVCSAWDSRIRWTTAVGAPALALIFVLTVHYALVIVAMANTRACREVHLACEGYSIFLVVYPVYAAILVALSMALGGVARLVGWLVAKRLRSRGA